MHAEFASSIGTPARVRCMGVPVKRWISTSARSSDTAVDFMVKDGADPECRKIGCVTAIVSESSATIGVRSSAIDLSSSLKVLYMDRAAGVPPRELGTRVDTVPAVQVRFFPFSGVCAGVANREPPSRLAESALRPVRAVRTGVPLRPSHWSPGT